METHVLKPRRRSDTIQSRFSASRQEDEHLDENTVRIISGVLAVLCVVIIIMRRKAKKKDTQQDDF